MNELQVFFNRAQKRVTRTNPPGFEACFPVVIGDDGEALLSAPRDIQRLSDMRLIPVMGVYEDSFTAPPEETKDEV